MMFNPAFGYSIMYHYSHYYYKICINYLIEEQWVKVNIQMIYAILKWSLKVHSW